MPLANIHEWTVSSYPGIAGSDSCYILKETQNCFYIFTDEYSSSGTSNGIQVTGGGSNDTVYITSTDTRIMYFKDGVSQGDSNLLNFYAYSSNCRIYGKGSAYAN
ncbi:MAG: hypothetical protein ACI4SE_10005 [Lachnospiraceae bacterium]